MTTSLVCLYITGWYSQPFRPTPSRFVSLEKVRPFSPFRRDSSTSNWTLHLLPPVSIDPESSPSSLFFSQNPFSLLRTFPGPRPPSSCSSFLRRSYGPSVSLSLFPFPVSDVFNCPQSGVPCPFGTTSKLESGSPLPFGILSKFVPLLY